MDTKDKNQNEKYLPEGCTSLWNSHQRALNFHGIKEGSQVSVTYNFELTTYTSNTYYDYVHDVGYKNKKDEEIKELNTSHQNFKNEIEVNHKKYEQLIDEAADEISNFVEKAKLENTVSSYQNFIENFPDATQFKKALE